VQDPPSPTCDESSAALAGNPPRDRAPGSFGTRAFQPPVDDRDATAGNPAPGHPPVKEPSLKEDFSSSRPSDEEATQSAEWPDAATAAALLAIHPRLDVVSLARRIRRVSAFALTDLDLTAAAADVLPAAARPVGDPAAYLATAILAEPERWVRTTPINGAGSESGRRSMSDPAAPAARAPRRPPTLRECADSGHRWHGEFEEVCLACGRERPGWRDDRDRANAAQATRHRVASGSAT